MASRGQTITVTYIAWDTGANAGKTGDVSNHALRIVKDGTSSAPTNSPAEVDSTNAPGVYKLVLTATECTADCVVVCGKSSTAGVSIMPITITFEQLPTVAPAANGGLPTVDSANGVKVSVGTGTGQLSLSSGQVLLQAGVAAGQLDFTNGVVKANAVQLLGTAWLTPGTAGTPDVNAKQLGGTSQTGRDIGASVLLSVGTGAGQLNVSGGKAPVTLNTADVTGDLAADLQTVKGEAVTCAAPVTVLASVGTAATNTAQSGDSFARLGAPAGASVSADIAAVLAKWTTAMTESYAADGAAPTPSQALMMLLQSLHEFAIVGTTRTVKKLDGSTTAMTFDLDSSTAPTSTTRSG